MKEKRGYERPTVSEVKLAAEEAVLQGCKSDWDAATRECVRPDGTIMVHLQGS